MSQTIHRLCGAPRLVEEQNTITVTDRTNTMEVRTMTDNRMELNRAIFNIIISDKPLKDMKEDVKAVRKAGYEIVKCDVRKWSVESRKNNRHVRATLRRRELTIDNSYRFYKTINTEGCRNIPDYFDRCKVDFVGILEKPLNDEWRRLQWSRQNAGSRHEPTSTRFKYARLQDAKYSVKWRAEEITKIQKKIADLQKELVYYSGEKVRAEVELANLRKKMGLKARR